MIQLLVSDFLFLRDSSLPAAFVLPLHANKARARFRYSLSFSRGAWRWVDVFNNFFKLCLNFVKFLSILRIIISV